MKDILGAALASGVPGVTGVQRRKSVVFVGHIYSCEVSHSVTDTIDDTTYGATA